MPFFRPGDLDHNLEITLELIANEEINIALGIARWSSSAEAMTDIHAALDMGTALVCDGDRFQIDSHIVGGQVLAVQGPDGPVLRVMVDRQCEVGKSGSCGE